jgi:hypothetical protein
MNNDMQYTQDPKVIKVLYKPVTQGYDLDCVMPWPLTLVSWTLPVYQISRLHRMLVYYLSHED